MLHNTRCHRRERRPSNTASLVALAPGKLATLLRFVREPHPNSIHNEWLDPPLLEGRLRFFLANEGVQLIQFCRSGLVRQGSRRQAGSVRLDPVDHALRIDLQNPSDGVVAVSFHIHPDGK